MLEGASAVGAKGDWPGLFQLAEVSYDLHGGRELERWMPYAPCRGCNGSRLQPAARAVRFHDHGIDQISAMTVDMAMEFFGQLQLEARAELIGRASVPASRARVEVWGAGGRGCGAVLFDGHDLLPWLR